MNRWSDGGCLKISSGCYVSRLVPLHASSSLHNTFTFNGFYPAMRQEFIKEKEKEEENPTRVHVFDVVFDEKILTWLQFRNDVIGDTNPLNAVKGSIRNYMLLNWKKLQLKSAPTMVCLCWYCCCCCCTVALCPFLPCLSIN
jgi:hypothetical protein